jgi:hypothetical protein
MIMNSLLVVKHFLVMETERTWRQGYKRMKKYLLIHFLMALDGYTDIGVRLTIFIS